MTEAQRVSADVDTKRKEIHMKKTITATLLGGAIFGTLLGTGTANADQSWTMPNLSGVDLQGAQDAIQSLTHGKVWYSSSTDLTGKGRAQIVDRNWIVCSSTPAPGTAFTTTTNIYFGVVRDTETCPS
jgi:hypothetical protein